MTDDYKQQGNDHPAQIQQLIYSNPCYILIINAEKQCNSQKTKQNKTLNSLLVRSSILLANNHLWTGRQTERRQRELKTAIKSNDQMRSNWFRKTLQLLRLQDRQTQSDDGLCS